MRAGVVVLLFCACSDDGGRPLDTHDVQVTALAGGAPDQGAVVIAHRANGDVLDEAETDELGHATVTIETNASVTTWFRWTPLLGSENEPQPEERSFAVTVEAPGTELVIEGPVPQAPAIGTLTVDVDQPIAATKYFITIGCVKTTVDALPATIEIRDRCLGGDTTLDVFVMAFDPALPYDNLGYAAGQATFQGGVAAFRATSWQTAAPPIPLVLDGVDPIVRFAYVADGIEILDDVIHAAGVQKQGDLFDGLAVENVIVRGFLASGGTTGASQGMFVRSMAGVPSEVVVRRDDFPTSARAPAGLLLAEGHATWQWGGSPAAVDMLYNTVQLGTLSWTAIVAPSGGSVTLPRAVEMPALRPSPSTRFFEVDELDGYPAAIATPLLVNGRPSIDSVLSPDIGVIRSGFAR